MFDLASCRNPLLLPLAFRLKVSPLELFVFAAVDVPGCILRAFPLLSPLGSVAAVDPTVSFFPLES